MAAETYPGEITALLKEEPLDSDQANGQLYQLFEVEIISGPLAGNRLEVESGFVPQVGLSKYRVGDRVLVEKLEGLGSEERFYIADYERTQPLIWLAIIFVALVVLVAQVKGVFSLLGMMISLLVIVKFVLPRILTGASPVGVVIQACLILLPVTFYFSHGFNRKTTVALAGTFLALVATAWLSSLFMDLAHLTGFASEEAAFLQVAQQELNIRGLLLAGMIVGVLGVLDDVTVSQAAIVDQLHQANSKLKGGRLFRQAMAVGRDHIGSMVNTLVLVYAGASLPLLLLFHESASRFSVLVSFEVVAEEIVRTLVGSIGLILAVPLTTFLAVYSIEVNKGGKK